MNAYFEKMLCQFIEGKVDFEIDFAQYPNELYRYRSCNDNNFDEIRNTMEYFYKYECMDIKKKYGNIFDKF